MSNLDRAILELEGVLCEIISDTFRDRLLLIVDRYRRERIGMVITTRIDRRRAESDREGSFFWPAEDGVPPSFTWKTSGYLPGILRRFRIDFISRMSELELQRRVYLALYLLDDEERPLSPAPVASPGVSASLRTQAASGTVSPAPPLPDMPGAEGISPRDTGAPARAQAQAVPLQQPDDEPFQATPALAARIIDFAAQRALDDPKSTPAENSASDTDVADSPVTAAPSASSDSGAAASPGPGALPAAAVESTAQEVPTPGRHDLRLPGNFYQEFFGFDFMPFNNTPDPRFYYPTEKHQEALSRMIYVISERKGFVMISGEIGSGKSTLCRTLLSRLPREVKTALITHTHLDSTQILHAIAEDLGLAPHDMNRFDTLRLINAYLIEQHRLGCTVCIMIDEAQNLAPETFEEIRMISNLETEEDKLVQLILLGQPELREKMRRPELRQLRERIAVRFHLEPLTLRETHGYIQHRLRLANPREGLDFPVAAMTEVHRFTGGVPRLVNAICDNALLTIFTRNRRRVTRRVVRESARDMNLEPRVGVVRRIFGR